MPRLRIVYELHRITYSGESVGDDWTFYVHTGAGLVTFDDKLRAGDEAHSRVVGVRELESSPEALERELWWASATEHDPAVPEHGAGLFTPVSIPLEPGVELRRTLEFDVAELRPRNSHNRVAHLQFEVRAQVELADDAPAPPLDATPLVPDAPVPTPQRTAGELPTRFRAELEGVSADGEADESIPVCAERRLLVGLGDVDQPNADTDPRALALANFLTHHSGGFLSGWFEPRAALYEVRNIDGQTFWAGENTSMGRRNHLTLFDAFAEAAPPLGGGDSRFEVRPSLLADLLGDASTSELGPSATAIAELVAALVSQHPERATVERELFVRTAIIDAYSGEWTRVLFVDPTPFAGPDEVLWMVAWTDAWTE